MSGPIRVYVAAPRQEVTRAREFARRLVEGSVEVTSSWLETYIDGEEDPIPASKAARDLIYQQDYEIWYSNILVALTADGVGCQTYVEIGMARAYEMPVIWSAERGGLALGAGGPRISIAATDADALDLALEMRA